MNRAKRPPKERRAALSMANIVNVEGKADFRDVWCLDDIDSDFPSYSSRL